MGYVSFTFKFLDLVVLYQIGAQYPNYMDEYFMTACTA